VIGAGAASTSGKASVGGSASGKASGNINLIFKTKERSNSCGPAKTKKPKFKGKKVVKKKPKPKPAPVPTSTPTPTKPTTPPKEEKPSKPTTPPKEEKPSKDKPSKDKPKEEKPPKDKPKEEKPPKDKPTTPPATTPPVTTPPATTPPVVPVVVAPEPPPEPDPEPIAPPEAPPENVFGYDKPIRGCFEGLVYQLAPDTPKLPTNYAGMDVLSLVYACEWDIPTRSWSQGFPEIAELFEWFAIRYSGTFGVTTAGMWNFKISSDDGAKLIIDGQVVINNDGQHPPQDKAGKIWLGAGDHEMVLEYFQGPRYHINLQLFATPPGGTEGIFSVR